MFLCWAVFGIYRLIRAELQLKSLPWAWGLFVLFLVGYVAGFLGNEFRVTGQNVWQLRLLSAFLITLMLAYGTAFSERKDPVAFRRLLQRFSLREWGRAMEIFPLWLSTLPFVFLSCAVLAIVELSSGPVEAVGLFATPAVAMVLFLLRDFGLLLFLNLGRNPKRADMLMMLFLVLLYGVIPTILAALDLDRLTGLFWPVPGASAEIILPAALAQAVVMLGLMVRRWRKSHMNY